MKDVLLPRWLVNHRQQNAEACANQTNAMLNAEREAQENLAAGRMEHARFWQRRADAYEFGALVAAHNVESCDAVTFDRCRK